MESTLNNNIDSMFNTIDEFVGISKEAKLIRKIVDIRTWLSEEYYSGPASYQIYPYWKNAIIKVFTSPVRINEVILGGCFIGDTKVPLLDGTVRTMKELADEYGLEKTFWVYSVDSEGNVVPGKAKNARKTGVNREVWKVLLDNGQELYCTPDHKFLTADLRYIQAKDLTPDISLYPSYIRLNKHDGRPEVYDLGTKRNGRWKKVHRLVGETIFDGLGSDEVVHHVDEDRLNNVPENLMRMSKSSHISLHNYKRMSQEKYKDISRSNFKLYNESELYKERREAQIKKSTEALKAQYNNPKRIEAVRKALVIRNKDAEIKSKMRETKSINWFKKWNIPRDYDELDKLFSKYTYTKYCSKIIGVKATSLFVNLQYLGWEDLAYKYGYKNHKIISVEFSHYEDVYDIEVEEYHNFMLHNACVVHNSIGTGKTTIACYMIAYKLYELSCYYPPQALYNLMNNSKILFAYFNINKEVAGQVGFSQIRDLIDTIPYFQNIFKRNEKINSILEWPQSRIYMKSASSSNDVLGMNLISFFVDEANFFKGDGVSNKGTSVNDIQSKARILYNSVRTRGKSRFVVNNEDFTFNVLVSSSMYDSSFTAERIQASAGDPHVMVFEPKIWEVKNVDTYSKERFVVFSGNELIDPVICNSVADINYIRMHYRLPEVKCDNPRDAIKDIKEYDVRKRFIEVPMNFRKEFEGNIIQALQDIAGVPVSATGKLFSNRDSYSKALTSEESPFTQDQIIVSTNANTTIQDYFKPGWKPKDPNKKRFLHFDQSTSGDSTGIAQCYIDKVIYDEFGLPKVVINFDWMIRINPPKPPHKIDIAKLRSIIPWQERVFGISYGMISYDTFQSAEAVQDLEKSGYNVQFRSVEKDKPYLDLTDLYYQGRIHHYRNEWYEKELFNLNWYRAQGRVDHPSAKEGGCLRGNTKIKMLNGTDIEIKDLIGKDNFWLYGCKPDGTIVPTKGRNCHITKYVDKLYRITLDNGKVIETTDNHKFMLRDGLYTRADELEVGQSLMPLNAYNHKVKDIEIIYLDKPEPVYDITVDETSNFALTNGIFVHNSKDLADAVCGSVANALEYPIVEEMQRENDIDFFLEDSKGYSYMSDKDELLNGFNFIN